MSPLNKLSVVIPVFNDEEVIDELHQRLIPVTRDLAGQCEVIYVDDGSTDASLAKLRHLQQGDPNIVIVKQARNFGQHNSIAAGLKCASGDVIILMDSDLQDRPEDIPRLLDALKANDCSMAIAKWISREDSSVKKALSHLFFHVSSRLTAIKHSPQLGVFRAIRRSAVEQVKDIPENTGTILSLLYWSGLSYVPVELNRDARFAGQSGYNVAKMLRLSAERIFSYSLFPIKIAVVLGVFLGLLSVLLGAAFIVQRFVLPGVVPGWTSIIVLILFLFGMNFIFLGLIGEYLGRIYLESKGRPKYITERIYRTEQ